MIKKRKEVSLQEFYQLNIGAMWRYFRTETLAFWMICAYLFLEYVRPQSIYPFLNFLPWTQLAVLGAFIGCFNDKSVKWVSSPINIWLVLFFVIIVLSSAFAYWPSFAFERLENFYTWFIIYFLIINIVNTEKRFFIFICIFFLATFKLSLSLSITWAKRGFAFTDWGLSGPPGFFQNSGELAIQMLVFWPLAWAFALYLKPHISKAKYFILLLMPFTAMMVVLGASSRGAQLALLVQLIVLNSRSLFKPKVLVSCAVVLSILWAVLPQEQKDRFQVAGDDRTSIQRLLYWENGIDMMNNHPGLGVGYFNYVPFYERAYYEDMLYDFAELPHNIFIQVGADLGYPALVLYLIMISYALFKTRKVGKVLKKNAESSFFTTIFSYLNLSLIGFVVAGQFVSVVYYPFLWIHFALFVCACNIVFSEVLVPSRRKKKIHRLGRGAEGKELSRV
ncbi:O-antigen ligase family protein [Marinobacter sp. M216]|uniref:O-antigen ligase family protein n=1 Tax=Marinobacter albus TaxID=3030833 RepID=A0ABT7HBC9_9GAMM|nr:MULTISPECIES: O-antigen ligase family protein [unclassified Marinobacter]MBW7470064.1 O-antigen ligase family protein [Marinobacter sp. F4218]MDK9557672.1 O-antigen ligase family protein [Marinobacter sp. M216]